MTQIPKQPTDQHYCRISPSTDTPKAVTENVPVSHDAITESLMEHTPASNSNKYAKKTDPLSHRPIYTNPHHRNFTERSSSPHPCESRACGYEIERSCNFNRSKFPRISPVAISRRLPVHKKSQNARAPETITLIAKRCILVPPPTRTKLPPGRPPPNERATSPNAGN